MAELDDYDPGGTSIELQPRSSTGEQRLMLALIEDGMRVLVNHKPQQWVEARDWIFGVPARFGVSFEYACHAVDLDPDYLRRLVKQPRSARKRWHPRVNGSRHKVSAVA